MSSQFALHSPLNSPPLTYWNFSNFRAKIATSSFYGLLMPKLLWIFTGPNYTSVANEICTGGVIDATFLLFRQHPGLAGPWSYSGLLDTLISHRLLHCRQAMLIDPLTSFTKINIPDYTEELKSIYSNLYDTNLPYKCLVCIFQT